MKRFRFISQIIIFLIAIGFLNCDFFTPTLNVKLDPIIFEGVEPLKDGIVELSSAPFKPVIVELTLSDETPARMTIEGYVIIPAFATTATFKFNTIVDDVNNGDAIVTVTASSAGYATATDTITVIDDD